MRSGTTLRAPDIKSNQSSGQCNALQDDQEASIDLRHGIVVYVCSEGFSQRGEETKNEPENSELQTVILWVS